MILASAVPGDGHPRCGARDRYSARAIGIGCSVFGVCSVNRKVLNVNMREFKWRGQTIKDIYRVGLPGIVMQSVVSL